MDYEKRIADLEKAVQDQQVQIKTLTDFLHEHILQTKQNVDLLQLEIDLLQNHGTQQCVNACPKDVNSQIPF